MRKFVIALVAALTIAGSVVAVPHEAEARRGAWVAAGVLGGLAAGAVIAGAPYYYAPPPPPAYYGPPAPAYYGGCRWVQQRYWDGYYWQVRPVQVC